MGWSLCCCTCNPLPGRAQLMNHHFVSPTLQPGLYPPLDRRIVGGVKTLLKVKAVVIPSCHPFNHRPHHCITEGKEDGQYVLAIPLPGSSMWPKTCSKKTHAMILTGTNMWLTRVSIILLAFSEGGVQYLLSPSCQGSPLISTTFERAAL